MTEILKEVLINSEFFPHSALYIRINNNYFQAYKIDWSL